MNKNKIVIVILFALIGAAGALIAIKTLPPSGGTEQTSQKAIYYCPMHPTYTSDRPGDCPICNMKLVKKENSTEPSVSGPKEVTLEELMSMKPGEICLLHKCKHGQCMLKMTEEIARSGKCPHCGDDLGVIVKDLFPKGYGKVSVTAEKQQLMGIKTSTAQKQQVSKTIRTVGRIAYDPQLYQAQEEFIQALASFEKAKTGQIEEIKAQAEKLVDSSKIRLKLSGLSDALIDEIAKAGKPDRSLLFAEAGGTVWLYAPIYEYEISLVELGDQIKAETASLAGKTFSGVIRSIDPVVDPMTRSVKVRAQLDNPDALLKPEMYVNATIQVNLGDVLVVPQEAVFKTGDAAIVFVKKTDQGLFEPREVELGAQSEDTYEVKGGLSEGEIVVTSGNFLIDSESRLKSALSGHQHG